MAKPIAGYLKIGPLLLSGWVLLRSLNIPQRIRRGMSDTDTPKPECRCINCGITFREAYINKKTECTREYDNDIIVFIDGCDFEGVA